MCTICKYNQVKELDRALLAGASLASLHQKYGFSLAALQHHQQHLQQKIARAQKQLQEHLHQGLACKLNIVLELVLQAVRAASAEGNVKMLLQSSREVTRMIQLLLKMDLHLGEDLIYCLLTSNQWNMTDSLLAGSLQALSGNRQALALNLLAPCPEPAAAPAPPAEAVAEPPAAAPKIQREISAKISAKNHATK